MKQEDLLEGYYVEYKNEYVKVIGITRTNHIILIESKDGNRHLVKDEELNPIELTNSILEKFEFEVQTDPEVSDKAILDLGDETHYIDLVNEMGGWWYDNFIVLYNVHDLQKLLSLCKRWCKHYPYFQKEIKL